jgi:hypothetical protein
MRIALKCHRDKIIAPAQTVVFEAGDVSRNANRRNPRALKNPVRD